VNISAANLRSVEYPDHIESILGPGLEPGSILFEVTESVATRNPLAADILTRLRLKGFELSIDDFGTGYSSLEALRRIPFSNIKVDQTFVADLAWSKDSLAIVNSVVHWRAACNLRALPRAWKPWTSQGSSSISDRSSAGLPLQSPDPVRATRPMAAGALDGALRDSIVQHVVDVDDDRLNLELVRGS